MILRPPIFTLFPYTTLFRSLLPIVGHYLLLLLGLGPLAVVFRHLNFNRRVAGLYRERVGVHGLSSHAASAVTAEPVAIGNKHELRTRPESPVALGRNEAHQELVPNLE